MAGQVDIDFSIEEDELIQGLLDAKGRPVEVVAFGIFYSGTLDAVEVDRGTITIKDGDDSAVIEIERIESFSVTTP